MASLSNKLAANKKFEFSSQAFGADKFAVVNMTGFESISKPFRFVLTLVSDDAGIDFDKVLQNAATFRIFAPNGASSTPYHGVIAEFDQLHQTDGYVFYRAVLVPRLWHLSLYQISEVYLNDQSIPQIIEKVLKGGRLTSADYEVKLSGSYRARSFVCQYQETHLDFISRWMEKEGMYFFFDHDGEKEKLLIADNRSMHPAQAVKVLYRPMDQKDTGVSEDSVQDFVCRQKPLPKQVILRDYNHRKANVELKVTETVYDNGIGEVNIYGENFRNEAEGQRYAKLRSEEILCGGKVFTGEATAVGLRSGYLMEMSRHYRDNFNGQYLVTEVHHEGSQAAALLAGIKTSYSEGQGGETIYRNTFRAIPAATQFRPERTTPRPRVAGTMNATIDAGGPSPYAELDEYGQYKVQLPFDDSDKAAGKGSARIRMASPYSGSDHGMNFPLHKDAEVLLSFIDGNPDEPVILGAVPNSENPSIVNQANPYENKITTAGGNVLHMGDQSGKEVMWLHSPFHNSTIGIGSVDPKGGGSIVTATGGSSESFTVGTSNALFLGFKNACTLATDNSLTAAITNKFALGTSVNFSLGYDVSWKKGKSVTLDDSDSYALKDSGKYLGGESTWLAGGQRMAVKAAVDAAKTSVQAAVILSAAVQAGAAAAAGACISDAIAKDPAAGDKGKVTKPWDRGDSVNMARGIGIAGGAVTAALVHSVMTAASKTIAAVNTPEAVYASNIKMGRSGIDIGVDDVTLVNKGSIAIKDNSVKVAVRSLASPVGSFSTVNPEDIELSTSTVAGLNSNLKLGPLEAKLSTENPVGSVLLRTFVADLKLNDGGLIAKTGTTRMSMSMNGNVSLVGAPMKGFYAGDLDVTARCMDSKVILQPIEAALVAPGARLTLNAGGAKVNGVLIQLG